MLFIWLNVDKKHNYLEIQKGNNKKRPPNKGLLQKILTLQNRTALKVKEKGTRSKLKVN